MYVSHSIAAHGRSLTRLSGLALAALVLTLALVVGASSAQASVTDPILSANAPTTTLHTTPWWQGGGSCTASGRVSWNRARNVATFNGVARSTAPLNGCKARLRVTFWVRINGQDFIVGNATADIPTACSPTDPACNPTRFLRDHAVANAINGVWSAQIDHITLSVEAR